MFAGERCATGVKDRTVGGLNGPVDGTHTQPNQRNGRAIVEVPPSHLGRRGQICPLQLHVSSRNGAC